MNNINDNINKCLNCKRPACINGCPLNTNIPLIIDLLKQGKIDEAIKLHYQYNSIGFICGRLCDHDKQCVGSCNLKNDPVKISTICTFLGDQRLNKKVIVNQKKDSKVAVIGGGISGLIVAESLLEQGVTVTIYEKTNRLGGVLAKTMPDFRFDQTILNNWLKRIFDLGLNVEYQKEIGKNLFIKDLFIYDFIVFATGAENSKRLFSDELTFDALKILSEYKNNSLEITNKNVVILGGGNTAVDVARVMKHLNNNVSIAYRRDFANSPAAKEELSKAKEEKIDFLECAAPLKIDKDNNQYLITFNKTKLVDDGSSRKSFKVTDDKITIKCDMIIEAIGASCDLSYLNETNLLDEKGYAKNIINDNIYIIGDAYLGPSSFVKANLTARLCVEDILKKI